MADASNVQVSFLGGEWGKYAQGRIDDPAYKTALNLCYNSLPVEPGAWVRRGGLLRLGHTYDGLAGRVMRLDFKQSSPYTMEFTNNKLRFFAGRILAKNNDAVKVTNISTANPAVVTTEVAHGWSTDEQVEIADLQDLCPALQGRQLGITVLNTTTFSVYDPLTGTGISGAAFNWLTPVDRDVTVASIIEITTPYPDGVWDAVRRVHTDEGAVLLHEHTAPQVLTVDSQPTDTSFAEFSLAEADFIDGPYLDPVEDGLQIVPASTSGLITFTLAFAAYVDTKAYKTGDFVTFSAVNYRSLQDSNVGHAPNANPTFWETVSSSVAFGDNGFTSGDIGRLIRFFSEPADWVSSQAYPAGTKVKYAGSYWIALTGLAASSVNPGAVATQWALSPGSRLWTWGEITAISNVIDRQLAGSLNVGVTFTPLLAAFDGNLNKAATACAIVTGDLQGAIGKNYTGAAAQRIEQATIFPPNNSAYAYISQTLKDYTSVPGNPAFTRSISWTLKFELRAKATAPSSYITDGTLLGTSATIGAGDLRPVIVPSNDKVTAWNYVWVVAKLTPGDMSFDTGSLLEITRTYNIWVSQVQFGSAAAAGSGNSVQVQLRGDPLLYTSAISVWRLGVFSLGGIYPTNGTYNDGRLWLSGHLSNRLDASRPGKPFDFSPTEPDGTVTDGNAIGYTLNGPSTNPIHWMRQTQEGIMVGTRAGEWLVRGQSDSKITATSIKADQVSALGSEDVEPIGAGHTTAFVQRYGRKLVEYFPDASAGKFGAQNIAKNARHLTKDGIDELAFQQEPAPVIWMRRGDNAIVGLTYKRETLGMSRPPEFMGWHQHDFGDDHLVTSITVGPSDDGNLDALTLVSFDAVDGYFYVSTLAQVFEEDADMPDAQCLDHALTPTDARVASGVLTLSGLWALNGKEDVTVFAAGYDLGEFTVTNGQIAITLANVNRSYDFDSDDPILVGYEYESKGQLLRPSTREDTGARNGPPFGKTRRAHRYAGLFQTTKQVYFGTDFTTMRPAKFVSAGGRELTDLQTFSGVFSEPLEDGYTFDSMLAWKATGPYPAAIMQLGTFLQTQDR
jgi:hypothetical protein